ncbi:unnamed protein product [Anisakis simplex]|uniref:Cystatin domain-containing protein n=1 Tax=Anisakis simplex TaxID=6269 RepID=A0A0M3JV01_ANISI|nr:unnamed protein product [Anisakis simplex]
MQVGSVVAIFLCALALIVSSQPWDGRYKKLDVNDEKIKVGFAASKYITFCKPLAHAQKYPTQFQWSELANKAVEKSNEKSQFPSWHALKEIVSAKVQVGGTQNTVLELNLHPTNCKNEVPKPKTECEMMKNTIGQFKEILFDEYIAINMQMKAVETGTSRLCAYENDRVASTKRYQSNSSAKADIMHPYEVSVLILCLISIRKIQGDAEDGRKNEDVNDPIIQTLADRAVDQINKESKGDYRSELIKIVSAKTQTINGKTTTLLLLTQRNYCPVSKSGRRKCFTLPTAFQRIYEIAVEYAPMQTSQTPRMISSHKPPVIKVVRWIPSNGGSVSKSKCSK